MNEEIELYKDHKGIAGRQIVAEIVIREEDKSPPNNLRPLYDGEERLENYELIKFYLKYGTPIIGITITEPSAKAGEKIGEMTGTKDIEITKRQTGQSQIWWGEKDGVLWECYPQIQNIDFGFTFRELLGMFWTFTENRIRGFGVRRIFTHDDDPIYHHGKDMDSEDYRKFLKARGFEFEEVDNYLYNRARLRGRRQRMGYSKRLA